MFLAIGSVLDTHEVAALRAATDRIDFVDGKATAGRFAREVKDNAQAAPSPKLDAVLKKVEAALMRHEVVVSAARPRRIVRMLLSRYSGGQTYGTHVDDALMAGTRTDLSFTLFLAPPEDYEGGDLVVEDTLEDRSFKLPAGDMILYPSGALHRVTPVTRGERIAVVGWITSWVRRADQREVLFDLDRAIAEAHAAGGRTPQFERLTKTRSNLLRMWAEG